MHSVGHRTKWATVLRCFAIALTILCPIANAASIGKRLFGLDDYLSLRRVTELSISSDGSWVAFVTSNNGSWMAYVPEFMTHEQRMQSRQVHIMSATGKIAPPLSAEFAGAWNISWIPQTHELAFLSSRSGMSQVYTYSVNKKVTRQITASSIPVTKFTFAPSGKALAYSTRKLAPSFKSIYSLVHARKEGILIDTEDVGAIDFLNPQWGAIRNASNSAIESAIWILKEGQQATKVDIPGNLIADGGDIFWAPHSQALALMFVAAEHMSNGYFESRTSLGVYDLGTRRFSVIVRGERRLKGAPNTWYSGGEWIPNRDAILVRRVHDLSELPPSHGRRPSYGPDVSFPEWSSIEVSHPLPSGNARWHPMEVYDGEPYFPLTYFPINSRQVLIENTVAGIHSLFELTPEGMRQSERVSGLAGSSSLFRFTPDLRRMVFVNQSLTRPPEVYMQSGGAPARRLTSLNASLAKMLDYDYAEVSWKGADGVVLKGWLLKPDSAKFPQPWPLITFVHGGPGYPNSDEFAKYWTNWPYPFEALAQNGMAVFMPNFRGTPTYGLAVRGGLKLGDDDAISDILIGVNVLVDKGIAQASRLGLSGHSYGATIGPLILTKAKRMFRASAFAEGVSNKVVMYMLTDARRNREIHDVSEGVSLYQAPEHYIKESADLNFNEVSTASLIEAGANSLAIMNLGLAKASRREGLPTEFVVYSGTEHNIVDPELQRESAERNFDWFRFWLQNIEDDDPKKTAQFKRWRDARESWKVANRARRTIATLPE